MLGHERLLAWKLCHQLVLAVYQASQRWPAQERFGLIAQIRRAASSAPTNIAEGAAKRGSKEYRRFLDIALGSLAETAYLLMLARDLDMLTVPEWERLDDLRKRALLSVFSVFTPISTTHTAPRGSSYSRAAHPNWFRSGRVSTSHL